MYRNLLLTLNEFKNRKLKQMSLTKCFMKSAKNVW